MKRSLATMVVVLLLAPVIRGETYSVDVSHSEVSFRIRHFVSKTPGKFTDYSATVELDPESLERSTVDFVVQAGSLDTDHEERDEHLRSPDFFWVERHPTLSFKSTRIRNVGGDRFEVTGVMEIRGIEKTITVPVEFFGFVEDPWGGTRAGFESTFTIDRKDYGIEWNKALDTGGVILGDEVSVMLNLELVRK